MDRLQSEAQPVGPADDDFEGHGSRARGPWMSRMTDAARKRSPGAPGHADDDRRPGGSYGRTTPGGVVPGPQVDPPSEPSLDSLVDITLLLDYTWFVLRSLRRHALGALATLIVALSVVGLAVNIWPKTYEIDGRLLVQQSSLVSTLVNPDRVTTRELGPPTLAAAEIVESHDNLLRIMKETNLMTEWERTRSPVLRLKDRIFDLLRGTLTDDQRTYVMMGILENRLQITTNAEGTIGFLISWPNAEMGRLLVDKAMQSFLEFRRATETAAITDSIAILDKSADAIEVQVRNTLTQLPKSGSTVETPRPTRRVATPAGPSAESTVRLNRVRTELDRVSQEVARLEAARIQQLSEAQQRLNAARSIYTETHPTVQAARQAVAGLSNEPAELARLRQEVRTLTAEHDELSTRVGAATANAEQARLMSQLEAASPIASLDIRGLANDNDPVGLRLKNQMAELASVHARSSAARAELSSLQAGFKYQYSVVKPPQVPREPKGPNVLAILGAGSIASLLLALAYAVVTDIASGRVLDAWQVERHVRAPVAMRIRSL